LRNIPQHSLLLILLLQASPVSAGNGDDSWKYAAAGFGLSMAVLGMMYCAMSSSDDDYYYYEIELTSFSYFAIGEKTVEEEEEGEGEEAEKKDLTWLWIIIGVVVLAAIIGGGITVKKREQ